MPGSKAVCGGDPPAYGQLESGPPPAVNKRPRHARAAPLLTRLVSHRCSLTLARAGLLLLLTVVAVRAAPEVQC